jgi:geranylgeranyl diphosphate synthase type I
MAYQIQDDALDLVGDESALGKPTFTDLRGGKKSVILLHCLDHCSGDDRRFVLGLLNRSGSYSDGEVSRLKRLLEVKGSLGYAKERVLSYTGRARKVLETVPGSVARSRLSELTDYLATRYY